MNPDKISRLREEIRKLKDEIDRREAAIPAHSVRPYQLQAIEDLEDRLSEKEKELKQLQE